MSSIGEVLKGKGLSTLEEMKREAWKEALHKSEDEFGRQRTWKVRLCAMVWSEIEVKGNASTAGHAAEQRADEATVVATAAPFAMRFFVQKRVDPKNPDSPLEWVEAERGPVDQNDAASPWAWRLKR